MTNALLGLALLAQLAAQPSAEDVSRAKAAEARAFVAIEGEQWCSAMNHFLEANAAAPSVDLIYNAAQAADLADDRAQALKLYDELVGAYPGSERQAQVNERVKELNALVEKEGGGTPCPAPAEKAVSEGPVVEPAPPAEEPPATVPAAEPALGVLPWSVVGGGALLMAGGAALSGVGAMPYFGFLDAREKILAAELAGTDAGALQKQQRDARESWQSWGELTTWAGVITLVTGALVTTGGLVWALGSAAPDEEAAPAQP